MKNIKKYIKLLKYGLQTRTMVILSVFFIGLGILYEFMDVAPNSIIPFSGMYLGIAGMYIYQVVITSSVSALVQVSPLKKKLQCGLPVLFTTFTLLITYTLFLVIRLCYGMNRTLSENPAADTTIYYVNVVCTAVLIAFIFLYFSFSYRYYIASTIALCIILIPVLLITMRSGWPFTDSIIAFTGRVIDSCGKAVIIIAGYLIVLAGAGLCYLFNMALYRKPLNNIAFRAALRQAQNK